MSPPQTMLTLPLGVGRDVTRAVACVGETVCAGAVVRDKGLVAALGKVELAELELVAAPLLAELPLTAVPPFAVPVCIGIAAAAATAAPAAAIKTTTTQTVLTPIAPRRFMPRRLSRRVSPAWTRTDCKYLLRESPIMATMLTQAAPRAKVRPVSSSLSGGHASKTARSWARSATPSLR